MKLLLPLIIIVEMMTIEFIEIVSSGYTAKENDKILH